MLGGPCYNNMSGLDKILVVGDSMIQKVQNIPDTIVRSYRGDNIEDLTNHLRWDVMPTIYDKDIILVHVGTNDVYTSTLEQMMKEMKLLTDWIHRRNPKAKLFLSAILPRPRDFWTTQPKIIDFNRAVAEKEVQWNFTYVHTYNFFQRARLPKAEMYYEDHLHASDKGAVRMGTTWGKLFKRIKEELGIPHQETDIYTPTVVTKKPPSTYCYPGQRNRTVVLFPPKGDFPRGPTYAPETIECHFPKNDPRRPKKIGGGRHPMVRNRWSSINNAPTTTPKSRVKSVIACPHRNPPQY